jgi:hypothetical protein
MRFQVLTVASMKMRSYWGIVPCSLVGVDRRFRGAYCLHHQVNELYFVFVKQSGVTAGCNHNFL